MKEFLKEKLLSRKFLTVVVAVVGAAFGVVRWDEIIPLVSIWLGAQGLADAAKQFNKESK